MTSNAFGLMFHHFHGHGHPAGQGAISAAQLEQLISYVGAHNVLDPQEWMESAEAGRLQPEHRCVTFDDALLCQYDIARPVLDSLGIKAFWFVYSGVFHGDLPSQRLEIYRHYRTVQFTDIEEFYERFFEKLIQSRFNTVYKKQILDFTPDNYLNQFPFYSASDRLFRYCRDVILGPEHFFEIMDSMIASDLNYSWDAAARSLWMKDDHVARLSREGHMIGLHSYTHPTDLASLSFERQQEEYYRNYDHIRSVTGEAPKCASHPCCSYNSDTLHILNALGVRIGFRSNMESKQGLLCMPREDHTNLLKQMGNH